MSRVYVLFILCLIGFAKANAQGPDDDQLGAWYMYFYNTAFNDSIGAFRAIFNIETGAGSVTGNSYCCVRYYLYTVGMGLNLLWDMPILLRGNSVRRLMTLSPKTVSIRKPCFQYHIIKVAVDTPISLRATMGRKSGFQDAVSL